MKTAKIEHYRDRAEKWRWRLVGANGEIVAASSQGFASRQKSGQNVRVTIELLMALS